MFTLLVDVTRWNASCCSLDLTSPSSSLDPYSALCSVVALLGWCFWPHCSFLEDGKKWQNVAFCFSKVRLHFILSPGSFICLSPSFLGSKRNCSVVVHSWFLPTCWLLPQHSAVEDCTLLADSCTCHCVVEPLNLIGAKHSLASCSYQWNCMSCCCKYLGSWCLKSAWVFHGFVESCRSSVQHSAQAGTKRVYLHVTEK